MSSRTLKLLQMCNSNYSNPKIVDSLINNDNRLVSENKENEYNHFNVMEMPLDIVKDGFLDDLNVINENNELLDLDRINNHALNSLEIPCHVTHDFDLNNTETDGYAETFDMTTAVHSDDLTDGKMLNCVDHCINVTSREVEAENSNSDANHQKSDPFLDDIMVADISGFDVDNENLPEKENLNNSDQNRDRNLEHSIEELKPRKRSIQIGSNVKKINQDLRMKGKKYIGYRRPRNQNKTFHDTDRRERRLELTCTSKFCSK